MSDALQPGPGPQKVAPATGSAVPTAAPTAPPVKILSEDEQAAWKSRITGALETTKATLDDGKVNVARYRGQYLAQAPHTDEAVVPTDFYYIEQKRAQLFYRLPDIYLEPQQPGCEDAAVVFQAAINRTLGPQGINILPKLHAVLFDLLCPVGFGAIKVGYQTAVDPQQPTVPMPIGQEPDPDAPPVPQQPGSLLGPQPAMKPVFQDVPNIVARWYFADRLPPGDLLVPGDFIGMDFDESPWLGMRFREDVPDGTNGTTTGTEDDDRRLTALPAAARSARAQQRTGYEIWYRASVFDPDVTHPDTIRLFRLYDGDDPHTTPVTVTSHPFAKYDPTGKLVAGMKGYAICPVTLRPIADSWLPPSDCQIARPLADELSKGRSQMLQHRNRSLPQVGIDTTRVDTPTQQKIARNETAALIGFNGPYQDATWPIQKGEFGRENFSFNDYIQRDLDKVWALGPTPGGALADTSRTASEMQIASAASQAHLELERNTFLAWYVDKVVTKCAALLQLFADEPEFVALVGSDAQRLTRIPPPVAQQAQQTGQSPYTLVPWNKDTIQGRFTFRARPDSQRYLDTAQQRKQIMDLYNFFANNPLVNHQELTREIVQMYGFDPSKLLQPPPAPAPQPPKLTLNLTAADLDPFQPQYQNVLAVLTQEGIKGLLPPAVDPATASAMQALSKGPASTTQHGGAAIVAEKLSQHPLQQTGGMQGSGAPAPMAPGGQLQ